MPKLILIYFLLPFVLFFFSSCASLPPPRIQPPEVDYVVVASWYGSEFHGRPTSSGEIFNMYAMTCAHKELPFGTKLRVTNSRNNSSVIVTVNDRGPFIPGRDLDLSYAAAREIGLIAPGVERVRIEYLGRDMRYAKMVGFAPLVAVGPFTIQVGSFTEESNAQHLKQGLELRYRDVYITTTYLKGQRFYRVRIGTFDDRERAYSFAKTLAEEGYSTFITKKD